MNKGIKIALYVLLTLLAIDAVLQIGLIGQTTRFNDNWSGFTYYVDGVGRYLAPHPLSFHQGDPTFVLASSAITFVLVGVLGFVTLALRSSAKFSENKSGKIALHAWLFFTLASAILILASLIVTFQDYNRSRFFAIFVARVENLGGIPYNAGYWAQETWYNAVRRDLTLNNYEDATLKYEVQIYRAWRWNLVPLLILSWLILGVAIAEAVMARRQARKARADKVAKLESQDAQA